jgi:hypothetical protein
VAEPDPCTRSAASSMVVPRRGWGVVGYRAARARRDVGRGRSRADQPCQVEVCSTVAAPARPGRAVPFPGRVGQGQTEMWFIVWQCRSALCGGRGVPAGSTVNTLGASHWFCASEPALDALKILILLTVAGRFGVSLVLAVNVLASVHVLAPGVCAGTAEPRTSRPPAVVISPARVVSPAACRRVRGQRHVRGSNRNTTGRIAAFTCANVDC